MHFGSVFAFWQCFYKNGSVFWFSVVFFQKSARDFLINGSVFLHFGSVFFQKSGSDFFEFFSGSVYPLLILKLRGALEYTLSVTPILDTYFWYNEVSVDNFSLMVQYFLFFTTEFLYPSPYYCMSIMQDKNNLVLLANNIYMVQQLKSL